MKIPGEELTGGDRAIKFIEKSKIENWSSVDVGERVAVIGAGNTAIEILQQRPNDSALKR